jgi:multimeric flavodoxin WrbA
MKRVPRVLIVMSSPRPAGNSSALAAEAARGAADAGAEVRTVRLAELAIAPCRACDGCRKAGAKGCVQDDDMTALHRDVKAADALIIASPVYWFTMSAQAKIFMDRLYAFGAKNYREIRGKRAGVILTSGDVGLRSSGAINAVNAFRDAFAYLGVPIAGVVHGRGGQPGAVRKNKALLAKAYALGTSLVS